MADRQYFARSMYLLGLDCLPEGAGPTDASQLIAAISALQESVAHTPHDAGLRAGLVFYTQRKLHACERSSVEAGACVFERLRFRSIEIFVGLRSGSAVALRLLNAGGLLLPDQVRACEWRLRSNARSRCGVDQADLLWAWSCLCLESRDFSNVPPFIAALDFTESALSSLSQARPAEVFLLLRTAFRQPAFQRRASELHSLYVKPLLAALRLPWTGEDRPAPWTALKHLSWAEASSLSGAELAELVPRVLRCFLSLERRANLAKAFGSR